MDAAEILAKFGLPGGLLILGALWLRHRIANERIRATVESVTCAELVAELKAVRAELVRAQQRIEDLEQTRDAYLRHLEGGHGR